MVIVEVTMAVDQWTVFRFVLAPGFGFVGSRGEDKAKSSSTFRTFGGKKSNSIFYINFFLIWYIWTLRAEIEKIIA
jgi:hypothetical protein